MPSPGLSPLSRVNGDTYNVTLTAGQDFATFPTLPGVGLKGGTEVREEEKAKG